MSATLQSWARALGGEVSGVQVLCPGPGHSAKDRSLSVKIGRDGQPVVHSHAGNDWKECLDYVRERLGMEQFKPNGGRKTVATYEFRDPASGEVRYRKERIESAGGIKSFFFKPKGRNGSEPLLYGGERLADVAGEQPVFVVEGEKMVDRLRELGAAAVSADSGYESKWLPSHADLLRGLNVVLWPDSDEPGEKYVANAADCLRNSAASIKVVRPFGPPNGAKGRDVCDWRGTPDNLAALAEGAEVYEAPEQEPSSRTSGNGQGKGDAPEPHKIAFTPYVWRAPETLPMRRWLYGKHYIRKYISATIGAGGRGKSSLDLVEAIAMTTGINLVGVPVTERLRVAYWGEDPVDEIERRVGAILKHFKIPREKIEGWLFVDSFRNLPVRIAMLEKGAMIFPDADAVTAAIIAQKIDVLICDPFVKTHGVSENDNGAIDLVARKFGDIADVADCSIELPRHIRKASNFGRAEVTADDGRGAGSLTDAVRCNRVLNQMTPDEATAAQVTEKDRKRYFRVDDDAKANMTAPTESATWFKLISVPLYNDAAHPGANGDEIGVVTSWQLPGVFAGTPPDALTKVQAELDAGGPWAKDSQACDWAGLAIGRVLEIDSTEEPGKTRVKALLKAWLKSGALKVSSGPSPTRRGHDRPTIIVGNRVLEGVRYLEE
ncbi:MAG: AAA family ATPase [Methylocella sp.]